MIHQPVSVVLQCSLTAWLKGMASGDQRRLTGSGMAREAITRNAVYKSTLLCFALLSNGGISNELERPMTQISRSRYFLRQITRQRYNIHASNLVLATALVLVGGDSQDARAFHGSSRSAMVHPSAFVLNGLRLVVVATPG